MNKSRVVCLYTSKEVRTGAHKRYIKAINSVSKNSDVVVYSLCDLQDKLSNCNVFLFSSIIDILKAVLKEDDVAYMFSFGLEPSFYCTILALVKGVSQTSFIRGFELTNAKSKSGISRLLRTFKVRIFESIIYGFSNKIVFQSILHRNIVQKEYKYLSNRVKKAIILPNNLPENRPVLHPTGAFKKHKRIIFVGSLIKRKRPDVAIDTLRLLKDKNISLFILGDGPLREELEQQAIECGVSKQVYFEGFVNNIYSYYSKSDVVIVPSEVDPFPNSVLEGLAHGKLVLGRNVDGIGEMLSNNLLFASTAEEYSEIISRFYSDTNYQKMLLQIVSERRGVYDFDWGSKVEKVIKQ